MVTMNSKDEKRIVVVDNFFSHPHMARFKGLYQRYWDKESHPIPSSINSFPGVRGVDLSFTDPKMNENVRSKIQNCLNVRGIRGNVNNKQDEFRLNYSLTFDTTPYSYHYDIEYSNGLQNFAGIIYLNPNSPKGYGTTLVFPKKKIEIENVFNRMVIYPTSVYHSLSGSFGTNRFNGRMVLSIFFNLLT